MIDLRPLALALLAPLSFACDGGAPSPSPEPTSAPTARVDAPATRIPITIDGRGYHPESAAAPAGQRVRLVFTRTADEGCGQQLVFPDLGIRRDLPLDEAVEVDVTMPASGSIRFTCGMDMYRGSIVAR